MVSPVLYERRHSFGFLISEEEAGRSRDQVTLLQQTPAAPPSTPSLSGGTSGSLATATIYCKVTYVGAFGETLPSAEASQAVTGPNGDVVVTAPSSVAGAMGWNLYASSVAGGEFLQNATPNALGSNYTLNSLVTGGVSAPTVPPNTKLPAGLILGATLDGTSGTYAAGGSNTGNFTCGTVTVGQGIVEGTYGIEFIAATVFNVSLPSGALLGEGHTGVAFSAGGLGFTLTAGGTAAVAGDNGTVAIAANANVGLYAPLSLSAADGTQTAVAILANETDASGGNTKVAVIDRAAQVNGSELIYPAAATTAQRAAVNASLAAIGVIVR